MIVPVSPSSIATIRGVESEPKSSFVFESHGAAFTTSTALTTGGNFLSDRIEHPIIQPRDDERKEEEGGGREHPERRILNPQMSNEGRCHEQSNADPAQDCAERTRNPDKQTDRESDLQDPDKIAQPIRQPVLIEFLNDVGIAHAPDKAGVILPTTRMQSVSVITTK